MEKIDKYYSVHHQQQNESFGVCICEAETREDALSCAHDSLWQDRADNADYGMHTENLVLCVNYYDTGNCTTENIDIELNVEKPEEK